jgi:hypothetical protein
MESTTFRLVEKCLKHLATLQVWRLHRDEVEIKLRPTVSRPVCLGVGFPSRAYDQIFVFCLKIAGFLMWGTLSEQRMGL